MSQSVKKCRKIKIFTMADDEYALVSKGKLKLKTDSETKKKKKKKNKKEKEKLERGTDKS